MSTRRIRSRAPRSRIAGPGHASFGSTRIRVGSAEGDAEHEVAGINLSDSGLLLRTRDDFLPADPVQLKLTHDPDTWEVAGTVVRVERDSGEMQRHLVAVAFSEVLPATYVVLTGIASRSVASKTSAFPTFFTVIV